MIDEEEGILKMDSGTVKFISTYLFRRNLRSKRDTLLLSAATKRKIYIELSDSLGWKEPTRDEAIKRLEIESVFGNPPYEFLKQEDVVSDRWGDGAHRRRHNKLDEEYKATRPGPNYFKFVPNMADDQGRQYRYDISADVGPRTLLYKRPVEVLKKARELDSGANGHPSTGDELILYHVVKGNANSITKRCKGHKVEVTSTYITPNAATGTVDFQDADDGSVIGRTLLNCI